MSWFKKKEQNLIPPVPAPSMSRPPSYKSTNTPVSSTVSNVPYGVNESKFPETRSFNSDGMSRSQAATDPYSRGERDLSRDRNELFAGYNTEASGNNRFVDGPDRRKTPPPGEEDDEDVEGIKQQIRYVKQESVNSSRNALRIAREAEETARNTLGRLGDQSEKLAITERHLDVSKGHSLRAEDTAIEIKQLNRSIFIPVITFDKKAKRAAQEQKRQQRLDEEREEREKAMLDIRETNNRIGRVTTYSSREGGEEEIRRQKTQSELDIRKEQRKRFQFEANASDDELEDELDDNLGEISNMTRTLKSLGTAMGQELDRQNERIGRIENKTVRLDDKIHSNTERLKRIR